MRARIVISDQVLEKLTRKHDVTREEIKQCLMNIEGGLLEDTREDHQTEPPTQWFIAETNHCRKLKIVFVLTSTEKGATIDIKTAYEPNAEEISIYERHGEKLV